MNKVYEGKRTDLKCKVTDHRDILQDDEFQYGSLHKPA